jgi:hypothetical protein
MGGGPGSGRWGNRDREPPPPDTRADAAAQETIRSLTAQLASQRTSFNTAKEDFKLTLDAKDNQIQELQDLASTHYRNQRSFKSLFKREQRARAAPMTHPLSDSDDEVSGDDAEDGGESDDDEPKSADEMSASDESYDSDEVPEPMHRFKLLVPDKQLSPQARYQSRERRADAVDSLLMSGGEHGLNLSGPALDPDGPPEASAQRVVDVRALLVQCVVAYVMSSAQGQLAAAVAAEMVRQKPGSQARAGGSDLGFVDWRGVATLRRRHPRHPGEPHHESGQSPGSRRPLRGHVP